MLLNLNFKFKKRLPTYYYSVGSLHIKEKIERSVL
nr:MAG TPA: hypothetical protein [Caudoviricetes sp.]